MSRKKYSPLCWPGPQQVYWILRGFVRLEVSFKILMHQQILCLRNIIFLVLVIIINGSNIFRMDDILGSKPFKSNGVGITTNAVSALVHFIVPKQDDPNDALMTDSIQQLALNDSQDADKCAEDDDGIGGEGNQYHVWKLLLIWL